MKKMQNQVKPVSRQTWRNKVTYVKKNWQLYLFFLMPGLLLTIIFKYLPMGGLLIAFEDYNVIKGVLGSPWVGLEYFRRFLSSPDFMNYLNEYIKAEYLRAIMGLSGSDSSGIAFESYPEKGSQEKSTASDLYAEFYFGDCALRYDPYAFITGRPYEQTAWNQYQLDDHAICIPYYLYCKRNLAGSRMGIDHVYGSIIEYKQRSRRSGTDGRCKPSAADLVCRASGDQGHYCNSVYPAGGKYYEHWF